MNDAPAAQIREANQRLIAEGDTEAIRDYFATTYVVHGTAGDLGRGHAVVRGFVNQVWKAFADLEVEVTIHVTGDDRIAWQRTMTGIHAGAFRGFPATDRPITWSDMLTSRFEDGLIVEEWAVSDLAERLLQERKR